MKKVISMNRFDYEHYYKKESAKRKIAISTSESNRDYRIDLVNSRYYYGVITYSELNMPDPIDKVNIDFLSFILWEDKYLKLYLFSYDGMENIQPNTLVRLMCENNNTWTFETNVRRCNLLPGIGQQLDKYISYEINEHNIIFHNINTLLRYIISNYTCPFCFIRSNCLENEAKFLCLQYGGTSKYSYSHEPWSLQKLCCFFIQNYWYKHKELIRSMLPSKIFVLITQEGSYDFRDVFLRRRGIKNMWI